jgi:hypothetical protein
MASRSEVLGEETICAEAALRMPRRFESLQAPLPLTGRLVGILRAVVEVPVLAVLHTRQNLLTFPIYAFGLCSCGFPAHPP